MSATMAETIKAHAYQLVMPSRTLNCLCGATKLSLDSWAAHLTQELNKAGYDNAPEAFAQGQRSGQRHGDRIGAARAMDTPELPGPISPNPYPINRNRRSQP